MFWKACSNCGKAWKRSRLKKIKYFCFYAPSISDGTNHGETIIFVWKHNVKKEKTGFICPECKTDSDWYKD